MCQEERELQSHGMKLECSLKGVLRETFLQRFMSDRHWSSLQKPPVSHTTFIFMLYVYVSALQTN